METWKDLGDPWGHKYEVSNLGRVRNKLNGKLPTIHRGILVGGRPGYMKVSLCGSGKLKFASVHRLVALAFIPGDSTLDVNHKDMDKTNNHVGNLEWTTHGDNIRHGMARHEFWKDRLRAAGLKRRKAIFAVFPDGTEKRFDSFRHAAREHCGRLNAAANIHTAMDLGRVWYGCRWRRAKLGE